MIFRVAFFLITALGLIGFGAVAWMSAKPPAAVVAQAPDPAPVAVAPPVVVKVLVAAKSMRAGSMLKPEDLVAKSLPTSEILPEMILDIGDAQRKMTGAMVRRALAAGDPIRTEDTMRPGDHGFLAAALEPGTRAVTIVLDPQSNLGGLIWPGDRVDLILTQSSADAALPVGRRVGAETVLTNARIIAIDQQLVQGAATGEARNHTVTLEVNPDQAQRLSVAQRLGNLSLSVRSANIDLSNTKPDAKAIPTWARDVLPSLLSDSAPQAADPKLRIHRGAGEVKEFKF